VKILILFIDFGSLPRCSGLLWYQSPIVKSCFERLDDTIIPTSADLTCGIKVYVTFEDGWESENELRHALNAAIEKDIRAVRVTRISPESTNGKDPQFCHTGDYLKFSECEFKPYQSHFNSNFFAVDHEEPTHVKQLKSNVMVVSFNGEELAYKFMTPKCHQNSFETEVDNYWKVRKEYLGWRLSSERGGLFRTF
jgi:hypothetical protein